MIHQILQPAGWKKPRGYANGVAARGRTIFVGGQVGWDAGGSFAEGFAAQVRQALENIVAVLREGGAGPEHLTRMNWYVLDIAAYRAELKAVGAAYREVIGASFPAMTLLQVTGLAEPAALVEIDATAVLPEG